MPQSSQRVEGIELKHIHILGFSLSVFWDFSAASKNSMGGFYKGEGFYEALVALFKSISLFSCSPRRSAVFYFYFSFVL